MRIEWIIGLIVLTVVSSTRTEPAKNEAPSVQHKCFAPGTTDVDYFANCPEGYYGDKIDV